MSEQRKMRAELRQGLHQFLMQLYVSYTQTMNKREAVDCISEVMKEEHEYFTGAELPDSSGVFEELTELSKSYEAKAKTTNDYNEQLTYYSKVEAISDVLDILKEERGND